MLLFNIQVKWNIFTKLSSEEEVHCPNRHRECRCLNWFPNTSRIAVEWCGHELYFHADREVVYKQHLQRSKFAGLVPIPVKKSYISYRALLKFMIFFLSFFNSTDDAWSTIGKHINRLWGSPQGVDDGFGRLHRTVQGLGRRDADMLLSSSTWVKTWTKKKPQVEPLLWQISAGIIATNFSFLVWMLCVGYFNRTRVPLESFDVRNANTKSV